MHKICLILFFLLSSFLTNGRFYKEYGPKQSDRGVILLDFNGYTPQNHLWGYAEYIPSYLSDSERILTQKKVVEYYDDWDVVITQDDSLFYTFPQNKRIRCVITAGYVTLYSWGEWVRPGGVSKYNTLYLGDTSACIISIPGCRDGNSNVWDVIVHESGHALGLAHQSLYKGSVIQEEYNHGDSTSAPIMGFVRSDKRGYWNKGTNNFAQEQDDTAIISKTFRRINR